MKTGRFELRGMLLSGRQHASPPAFGPRADLAEPFFIVVHTEPATCSEVVNDIHLKVAP